MTLTSNITSPPLPPHATRSFADIVDKARTRDLDRLRTEWRHEKAVKDERNQVGGLIELIEYAKPRTVLEIGSHFGVSTETFALLCGAVVCIDPWPDEWVWQAFLDRCGGYTNINIYKDKSPQGLNRFAPKSFDLVYIDGEHWTPDVTADIIASKRVASRWIAGHDFHHATVAAAVRKLLGEPEKVFPDSSWIIKAQ